MGIPFSVRLTVCAALVTAAGGAAASAADGDPVPAAGGGGGAGVRVTPLSPRPGDEIDLTITGCAERRATARSDGFAAEALLAPAPDDDGNGLFGEARVSSTVEPGVYSIDVSCDGADAKVSGRLVITGTGGGGGGRGEGEGHGRDHEREPGGGGPGPRPGEPAPRPTGPVEAGGGGTAGEGPGDDVLTTGPAGLALGGGALLGAGTLLAVRRLRRR
ncbi:hypothetical protein [Streptomyces avicenniae]|uniref:hypothetical protein n=1 Tax=Streptomyces avicenniae TaxID=500153 RepID=UPI00069C1CE1|nr:hypothetical protein [Streptomyces avicenniae]